ncbi:leucine-rich repeat neuronal protein 4-like [Leucoraja erinacea]|uniref:leucine-rich repeat neuronal protein 4-like n=1 Tax=Leucoraja erinaceus TaxID=7782 RepID=UPI002455B40C|nr:leucine-rich repeat neuronal protein 4-like [Leucoraja erinacea]
MELVALFLLAEAMFFHSRINGSPIDQIEYFSLLLNKTYSQNDNQLHLTSQNINSIPVNAFQNVSALERLELSHNNLTDNGLPCGSLNITTLKHLSVASNQLTRAPSCLPTALKYLDLSHNAIQQIAFSKFMNLHNLTTLLLSHNKISTITYSGTVLPHLASLDLGYNKFTKLQWKFKGPNLTSLRLEGNPLQKISTHEFSPFPKLQYLNLSSTSLESCSHKAFATDTENIKVLDLSENLFKTFDRQCFDGLSNLQTLWMRRLPFLQSLPVDLFLHTSSLIHVNLDEIPQLYFLNSSMFEQLRHLQTLSLQSCNLTEFKPWTRFNNSTIKITLFGNRLACSCELTWLTREPEKILLTRTNDTRCVKSGRQKKILLAFLIDQCNRNENSMQKLQTNVRSTQTIVNASSQLPTPSSTRSKISITSSFTESTNLLKTFLYTSSKSSPGSLPTEEGATQKYQAWNKIKSRLNMSTTLPTTTRDQVAPELYSTTTRDRMEASTYPTTSRNKSPSKRYPLTTVRSQTRTKSKLKSRYQIRPSPVTTTREQTASGSYSTTYRVQTDTKTYPTIRDQTRIKLHPPTVGEQTVTEPYSITRDLTVTEPYSITRNQIVTEPYSITREQTVTEPYSNTRDQTVIEPYMKIIDQTVTESNSTTSGDQMVIKPYSTTGKPFETELHLSTARDETVTELSTTTTDQTTTTPHPATIGDHTAIKSHSPTTSDHTGTTPYLTIVDQTGTEPNGTIRNQTGHERNLTITRVQTAQKYYPSINREKASTKHYPAMTLQTSTPPACFTVSTTKKGPKFIVIDDADDAESLEKEEITSPLPGDCNYDPCRHWQVPCHELQHLTDCRCPATTGEDVIPEPVKIQKVIKISDNAAEIYWCSPSSTVLYYYIIYQSDENRRLYKTDTIKPTYRRYTLRDLTADSTYHTCVVAVNNAGSSTASSIWPSKGPCYIFKTKPNYNNIFYITSTVIIVILFILVVILSFCLCKIHQKRRLINLSSISLDPLSLQNPAFDDHLELADSRTIRTRTPDSEQIL